MRTSPAILGAVSFALALPILLTGCASVPTAPTIYALAGNELVPVDGEGQPMSAGRRLGEHGFDAVTFDPDGGRFYGVRTTGSRIELWSFSERRGRARRVAPVAVVGSTRPLVRVETLAWDRPRRRLLAGAGTNPESPFSGLLLEVDPRSGVARELGEVRTTQRDIDGMAFVDDQLVVLDQAIRRSFLYRIDFAADTIAELGSHAGVLDAIAWDPANRLLLGIDRGAGMLLRFDVDGDRLTLHGTPLPLAGGEPIQALSVAVPPGWQAPRRPTLHSDGFESGNLGRWSASEDSGGA